jgi:hypothetical protein
MTAGWHLQILPNANCNLNGDFEDNTYPPSYTINSSKFVITGSISHYYRDADSVVRRAMGAYTFTPGSAGVASAGSPLAVSSTYSGHSAVSAPQVQSRPLMLNRPYRTVGELGHVFSGTPWKNIDFFTPESGDAALLDVFTTREVSGADGMVAGKVNLNTRQAPVLQAVLAGAFKDEQAGYPSPPSWKMEGLTSGSSGDAGKIASALVSRTSNANDPTKGPLRDASELVGRYTGTNNAYGQPFGGFAEDLTAVFGSGTTGNIQRLREAPVRALGAVGQARCWNLMVDVVAQVGRYPAGAKDPSEFTVEGEQRRWVHLAIDRWTGQVMDQQIEVVRE